MKTKTLVFLLISAFGQALNAQNTQERTLSEITGIRAGGAIEIIYTQGTPQVVKITADDKDILPEIETEVENGVLSIKYSKKLQTMNSGLKIELTTANLNKIDLTGAASFKSTSVLKASELDLNTSGAANLTLNTEAGLLKTEASGASSQKISGKAESLKLTASGAANIKGENLETSNANATVSGAASAKINPKEKLDADVSGAGNLKLVNEPAQKNVNVSGAGSIKKIRTSTNAPKAQSSDTTQLKLGSSKIMIINENDMEETPEPPQAPEAPKAPEAPQTSQPSVSSNDSTPHFNWKKKLKRKNAKSLDDYDHWSGFDIGVNGYADATNNLSLPKSQNYLDLDYGKSFCFAWNIFDINIPIARPYVQFLTGLGIEWNMYNFRNSTYLDPNTSTVSYWKDTTISFDVNKLKLFYLNVPLLVQFNTSKRSNHSVHLATGVTIGYKISSWTKQEYTLNGYEFEVIKNDDYLISPFRVNATLRAGYGNFVLFANYGLNGLFEANKGPTIYPFSVGINIGY